MKKKVINNEDQLGYELFEENDQEILSRYQINSYSVDRAVETLLKWKKSGKLSVPEFQRDYVWSYNNSCRFIDSILLNLPIPNIFVFKIKNENEEKYLLVDGMQRITTMEQFHEGIWQQKGKKKNFKISLKGSPWDKCSFDLLSDEDQQFFLDYSVSMIIFESNSTNVLDLNKAIFSVFERINTGSERLSDQEIRNAIYDGQCLSDIKEFIKKKTFKDLTDRDNTLLKREKNVEFVTRLLTYLCIYKSIKSGNNELVVGDNNTKITASKTAMLNLYLSLCNLHAVDYTQNLYDIERGFRGLHNYKNAFYAVKRDGTAVGDRIHEVFAEALILAFIENGFLIKISPSALDDIKLNLWNSKNKYYKLFTEKTTATESIIKRVDLMLDIINGKAYDKIK